MDMRNLGARRVMMVTDAVVAGLRAVRVARAALEGEGYAYLITGGGSGSGSGEWEYSKFDEVAVEPDDTS